MTKIVKICGVRSHEASNEACNAGSDFIGVIMVPNRKRTIDLQVAKELSKNIRSKRETENRKHIQQILKETQARKFETSDEYFYHISEEIRSNGPFLVGVFRNQSIDEVYRLAEEVGLDFIQLHGNENKADFLRRNTELRFGVIPRFVIPSDNEIIVNIVNEFTNKNGLSIPLLDSELGGEGQTIDWDGVGRLPVGRFILAGGLTPDNLHKTKHLHNVIGYDVSGGVENEDGEKDIQKINDFIKAGKSI